MAQEEKQELVFIRGAYLDSIGIYAQNHRPSWKRLGTGRAQMHIRKHQGAEWLEISLSETFEGTKRDTTKETRITLDTDIGRQLYEALKTMYEIPKEG